MQRFLVVVVVVCLPCLTGCSPSILVPGAIAGSVLYAHLNKDHLPARRNPMRRSPRPSLSRRRATGATTVSHAPAREAASQSADRAVAPSPIVAGALAYRQLRWGDAVRLLTAAVDAANYSEPELAGAHVLLGAIAYQQGDAETARNHFIQARRHDPQLELSPQLFPPQLIDFYRNVRSP